MGDMIKGNIAIAEAAVRAGVKLYAGYPITLHGIMEYLSKRLPEVGQVLSRLKVNLQVSIWSWCCRMWRTRSHGFIRSRHQP